MLAEFRGQNKEKVHAIYVVSGVKEGGEQAGKAREVVLVPEDKLQG